jgi:hypothetical protein
VQSRCTLSQVGQRDLGPFEAEASKPPHRRTLETLVSLFAHEKTDGERISKVDIGKLERRRPHGD